MNPPEGSKPGDPSHVKVSQSHRGSPPRGLAELESNRREGKRASDNRGMFAASPCLGAAFCAVGLGSSDAGA